MRGFIWRSPLISLMGSDFGNGASTVRCAGRGDRFWWWGDRQCYPKSNPQPPPPWRPQTCYISSPKPTQAPALN
ncbi:MAG: hypothetical protein AAGF75_07060, partial [Cyanobacteria bacterium P01_H01_bin.130]